MIPTEAEIHTSLQASAFATAHLKVGNNVIGHVDPTSCLD